MRNRLPMKLTIIRLGRLGPNEEQSDGKSEQQIKALFCRVKNLQEDRRDVALGT